MDNWGYFTLLIGVITYNPIYNWIRGPPCKDLEKTNKSPRLTVLFIQSTGLPGFIFPRLPNTWRGGNLYTQKTYPTWFSQKLFGRLGLAHPYSLSSFELIRGNWRMWAPLTLPETNSSPLKIGLPNRKVVFQPSIFQGAKLLLVSGRVKVSTANTSRVFPSRGGLPSSPTLKGEVEGPRLSCSGATISNPTKGKGKGGPFGVQGRKVMRNHSPLLKKHQRNH